MGTYYDGLEAAGLHLRAATEADLPGIGRIWAADQQDDSPVTATAVPSLYLHELASRELAVAEHDGQLVGFAALLARGRISFLADLFVDPDYQSRGVGSQLLHHVLPRDGRLCCTLSSSDPRALSLYIRSGMRPYWPCFQLRGVPAALPPQPLPDEPEVVEATAGDPELADWDSAIGGRPRPQDHAYWFERRGGVPLWFVRRGKRVGYGYAQLRSDDVLGASALLTLGPIGARERADATTCVIAALRWASSRAPTLRVSVPGPHPALALLLSFGLRIHDVDTFCSTRRPDFVDLDRYLPSGGDLF